MDWSRTKNIFIVTFLLLNAFLGFQYYQKQKQSELIMLPEASTRVQLETNRIEIAIDNADVIEEGAPITAEYAAFEENLSILDLERQDASFLNESTLYSELHNPYRLVSANLTASVDAFLQQYVYEGEKYALALYDEEAGEIGLYQMFDGKKIDQYTRDNFHLTLYLSDNFEVLSYEQIHLNVIEQGDPQELLSPETAVVNLLNERMIPMGTTITAMEIGYYSYVTTDTNFQVYAPVWRIRTERGELYFVDALHGGVQPTD